MENQSEVKDTMIKEEKLKAAMEKAARMELAAMNDANDTRKIADLVEVDIALSRLDIMLRRVFARALDQVRAEFIAELRADATARATARAALAEQQDKRPDAGKVLNLAAIIRHVDGSHRLGLGAAALAEAILSHPDIGLVLANSEGPAVPEGREPASVADHYSPIQEALNKLEEYDQANPYHDCRDLIAAARVALARWGNQPTPPAKGEVAELVAWLRQEFVRKQQIGNRDHAQKSLRAVELLQQQQAEIERLKAQQTPVPASERLPGQKDLSNKRKYCWWWNCNMDSWFFCDASYCSNNVYTHWLPAHALPMPQGEVEK